MQTSTDAAIRCRASKSGNRSFALAALVLLAGLSACGGGSGNGQGDPTDRRMELTVRSSQAQFVSGGSALIDVAVPDWLSRDRVRLTLNGADVTSQLGQWDADRRVMRGLISGLKTGTNDLRADSDLGGSASLTLTDHPVTGPILSGPHLAPYECRTVQAGLGAPLDADCSATRQIQYWYKSTDGSFKPLPDPAQRPADLANTEVPGGASVPYIVRVDSGTVNRGIYRIAVLDDPAAHPPGAPWTPTSAWNGRLIVSFGCCASAQYNQGLTAIAPTPLVPYALSDLELSRGFAYMVSSELWNNQHANPHLQGETLMMLKEFFIKNYGLPRWTAGTGGSGGAIQQYLIAQLYPGLLDGIQPALSFPDSMMPAVTDCRLLNNVFKSHPLTWLPDRQQAVSGLRFGQCVAWDLSFANALVADNAPGCGLSDASLVYDARSNPNGARCDIFDTNVNLLGRDPATGWARRPLDNVGVQYGLSALNGGQIGIDDFLDLNEQIGGYDNNGNTQAQRTQADPEGLRLMYAGGLWNSFSGPGLANIPIITQRGNADTEATDIHDSVQDLVVRARLQKGIGRSDNQVIFAAGSRGGVAIGQLSLDTMTQWLDAIIADPAPPSTDKVVRLKPESAQDSCWDASGQRIVEPASLDPNAACNKIYPRYSQPRWVAGAQTALDVAKCQLKPIDAADYAVAFTPTQMDRLRAIFPTGVCDWSKPGVNQVPLQGTYLSLPLQGP